VAIIADDFRAINSTIVRNSGGGIGISDDALLQNSLLADNGAGDNCEGAPTYTYQGRNLSSDDSCGDPTEIQIADPVLDTLADNGGPAPTHALLAGSPAIDAGTSCGVTVDQRYVARDAACDLGAFEFIEPTEITLAIDGTVYVNPNTGWAVVTGVMQCSRDESFALEVDVEQKQRLSRTTIIVKAADSTAVACGPTARPWSVALAPSNAAFQNGSANVTIRTSGTPAWATPAMATRSVKLFWGHR
jgi:hypothetical protein